MNNKTVSVHIVTYNSANDIIDCLEAVMAQDYPIEKIVVVDNASSDDCAEKVNIFFNAIDKGAFSINSLEDLYLFNSQAEKEAPTSLLLIQNQKNTGFAPAHNQAIATTETDYVLVLNPDLTLAPDYISRLIAQMEANSQIGSATGKLLLKADHGLVDSTGLRMNKTRRAFDRGAGEPAELWTQSGTVFGVSGAAAMYSRRMIEDVSVDGEFFDADFFAYKEDVDVAWRAQLFGWQGYYDAEAIGYHERGWKTSGRSTKPMFIRRISYINRYKMIYKNESARTMLKTILISLPYEIAAHGYMLLREPKLIVAWKSFFTQLPALKKKRKYIQTVVKERKNT
ncbi:glycosyl transferase [Paenibacillus odorifer]|uniref:glycosyltransferase family 2 protein n=1 Tax=Paenibacillus TaxID=44249 RepID=UPI00096D218A|nr:MULTISPECIES: glycosyltransferase family 2 protein [Paenibacillus]MDH6428611.1 GT2 family glycosyltransferase [Paenibacillus sp. PastH-4]MDH6444810.1 GT2 family glycosyltransferase [Paenibacillus sp. PastF-4]MDH6528706.1 GT2 family glycosyltransferase [Paenibacillus sp. PastH-3]OMD68444.1 glycosyl transferase [Paenibacillus odorifer]